MSSAWTERRVALGGFPTPVRSAEALRPGLWLKDDGGCHDLVGGNKVRKLEFLLHAARPRVVTLGVVGSHHVLATAVHARNLGHTVEAVVSPRPDAPDVREVLQATLSCATLHRVEDYREAHAVFTALAEGATGVPAGGSSAVGALGYVLAAQELADQVRAGLLPEPRRIFVALGTAGTVAGLVAGLRHAGLQSEVVAVRVVPLAWLAAERVGELIEQTAEIVGSEPGPFRIDNGWLGEGYGHPTLPGEDAVTRARGVLGLALETTYTGKALGAAMAASGGPDLFWNTHSSASLAPLLVHAPPLDLAGWMSA